MPKMKTPALLSITKATSQARRIADRIMPGYGPEVNVSSRLSHDLEADVPTVVTVITFPPAVGARVRHDLKSALYRLSGWWGDQVSESRIEITRTRS